MGPLVVAAAAATDLTELAAVAAATFPLACPPSATAENIAAFVAENLSAGRFGEYLADPDRAVFVARADARILGYAMLIHIRPADPDVLAALPDGPTTELSKIYVSPDAHGGPVAAALMRAAIANARDHGTDTMWLGVNQQNDRAQRFYRKHGFAIAGTKTFQLGDTVESDYVMTRGLGGVDTGGGQRQQP